MELHRPCGKCVLSCFGGMCFVWVSFIHKKNTLYEGGNKMKKFLRVMFWLCFFPIAVIVAFFYYMVKSE